MQASKKGDTCYKFTQRCVFNVEERNGGWDGGGAAWEAQLHLNLIGQLSMDACKLNGMVVPYKCGARKSPTELLVLPNRTDRYQGRS